MKTTEIAAQSFNQSINEIKTVSNKYPVLLSSFLKHRIEDGTYSIEAAKQYLPNANELIEGAYAVIDPCNENLFKEEKTVIQKYENRIAIILTQRCLSYCRFCFRKDFVGYNENNISDEDWEKAILFVSSHPAFTDILLSGGDPLAIPNSKLIPFLERLCSIPHVEVLRIHTRALSLTPSRINDELVEFLKKQHKFWFYTHMNHPDDLNHPEVLNALRKIQSTGTPVLNQSVILKGINDNVSTIKKLLMDCYSHRVIPYHLYVFDSVKGAEHFKVEMATLIEIFKAISEMPGPAQPVFIVVDNKNSKRRFVYDSEKTVELLKECLTEKFCQINK